ncbi:hypothetical protein BCR42DRAFT_423897, partial [Absidia repens]
MPTLRLLFILLFTCVVFGHIIKRPSYESFTPAHLHINDNKTIDEANLPVCPLDASTSQRHAHDDIQSTTPLSRLADSKLPHLIASLKSSTLAVLEQTTEKLHHTLNMTKKMVLEVEYAHYIKQVTDYTHRIGDGLMRVYVRPLTYGIRRAVWPLVYGLNDRKDDMIQLVDDIYVNPGLEWHIFTTRMTGYWMNLCRHLGIDSSIRHLRQQILKRLSSSSTAKTAENMPPFSHLDDLFKTMLETDYHSKFYRQQMAQYYQWLSPQDQARVLYSKREFIHWAKDGASKTHEFVIQTQQDWIQLMQSLYHDMEIMLNCLSLPPPTTFVMTMDCSPKNRRQALLLLSPTTTPTTNTKGSHHIKTDHGRTGTGSSSKRQRYQWMFELEQIHRELKTTIDCICPRQLNNDDDPTANTHNRHQQQRHQQRVLIDGAFTHTTDHEQQHQNNPTANLDSIDMLADLKKTMKRRYARLDKELHRLFFKATPPHDHQPMHYIYERLRENVSAMNKSTYDNYLTQLILSWTSMMANTLDMANSVADDMSWLLRKQQENSTTSTRVTTETPNSNSHGNDKDTRIYQQHEGSMELIWTSAQRKMERNNHQLINQWELIFTDMDQELQAAWLDMLDMVEETHQSSFERVKNFWYYNKVRLSNFFSSLFQYDHDTSMNVV